MRLGWLALAASVLLAAAASAQSYRIVEDAGRRVIERPDGTRYWAHGFSVDPSQGDLLRVAGAFGCQPVHIWSDDNREIARLVTETRERGLDAAVFVPLNGPYARFVDGSRSGDNIPFQGAPWSRVPDFYDPAWQEGFVARLLDLEQRLGGSLDGVAVLWIANEPEVTRGYGDWNRGDHCLDTPSCRRKFRFFVQQVYPTIDALNARWNEGGDHRYAFADFQAFAATCLEELARDRSVRGLSPAARADYDGFVRQWLGDWTRTVRDLVRVNAGIAEPLLGIRLFPGCIGPWSNTPTDGLDLLGVNWYDTAYGTGYLDLQQAAFAETGLPTILSEWFTQHTDPGDLGYVCGDEATQAEQVAFACDLMRRCPTSVGEIWQNYGPNPGSLAEQSLGHIRPFLYHRTLLAAQPLPSPQPGDCTIDGLGYRSDTLEARPSWGPPGRDPAIRWKAPFAPSPMPLALPVEPGPFACLRGSLEGRGLVAGGPNALGRVAAACTPLAPPYAGRYRAEVEATASGDAHGASLVLELNGMPRLEWPVAPGAQTLVGEFAAPAQPCYLTIRADAGASLSGELVVTRVRLEAADVDAAPPPPLLPDEPVQPDLSALPVAFEDPLSPPDPARWLRHSPEGDGGAWATDDVSSATLLTGAPLTRSGIVTREAFGGSVAEVSVTGELARESLADGNLILNLVFDRAYPPVPSWEWALRLGPSPTKRAWSGGAGESRLEFGWSPGKAWHWRVSNGVACPGPVRPVEPREGPVRLTVSRVGCRYVFSVDDRPVLAVYEPALSGPFRVFLYGFGPSRGAWRDVRVRAIP